MVTYPIENSPENRIKFVSSGTTKGLSLLNQTIPVGVNRHKDFWLYKPPVSLLSVVSVRRTQIWICNGFHALLGLLKCLEVGTS